MTSAHPKAVCRYYFPQNLGSLVGKLRILGVDDVYYSYTSFILLMNQELQQYIQTQRTAGYTDEQIQAALRESGWEKSTVLTALGSGEDSEPIDKVWWVRQLSRTLAVIFGVSALYSFLSIITTLSENLTVYYIVINLGHALDDINLLLLNFWGAFLIVELLFATALWRIKRWTIPVIILLLIFAAITLLVSAGNVPWVEWVTDLAVSLFLLIGVVYLLKWRTHMAGSMRKLWLQIPLFIFFSAIATVSLLPYMLKDEPVLNDADLQIPYIKPLDQEDNAYYAFAIGENLYGYSANTEEFGQQTRDYFQRYINGELDMTDEDFLTYLEGTRNYSEAFNASAVRSGYQCPQTLNQYNIDITPCALGHVQVLNQINILHGAAALERGEEDEWLDTMVNSSRIAQMVTTAEPLHLIHVLLGVANYGMVANSVELALSQHNVSTSTQAVLLSTLREHIIDDEVYAKMFKIRYLEFKNTLVTAMPEPDDRVGFLHYYYHPNATLNEGADLVRDFIAVTKEYELCSRRNTDVNEVDLQVVDMSTVDDKFYQDGSLLSLVSPNLFGRILLDSYWLTHSLDLHCDHNIQLGELITKIETRIDGN